MTAWENAASTKIAAYEAMTPAILAAERRSVNSTLHTFSGFCDKCYVNCDNCTGGWFMTPDKSCVSECDTIYNTVSKIEG